MPGLFSRIKTWVTTEDVVFSDLNAEFDNIITNFVPLMIDDYSTNVAQMQVKTDPGEVGTESLATTLAGEIARLRHMITEITGQTHWYTSPSDSLAGLAGAIGTGLSGNRLVSGRVRSTSEQPMHLVAHGAARTVTLKGASTNFLYYVEDVQYTIDADVTLTNLTLAPSSNNTCLVNDTVAADQHWTKYTGEDGTEIPIDTIGSEISALAGKIAAFKLNNGSDTEYFIARVETDKLTRAYRGYFFDSSDNPIPRVVYSNNDTITLMKLGWVFAKSDETLTVVYTNPIWSGSEPSSPSNGDYWFDLDNEKWKKYDVSAYVDADATLVGVCIQDTSNCVAARSFEFFKSFDALNTNELVYSTAAIALSRHKGSSINVWGETFKFDHNAPSWDMGVNLESGFTEASNTYYYFYVTEDGVLKISGYKPFDRREDLQGYYHPYNSWRCVGSAFNDGSSNLSAVNSYFTRYDAKPIAPAQTTAGNVQIVERIIPLSGSGGAFTKTLPAAALWKGSDLTFVRTDQTIANVVTLDFYGSEAILDQATRTSYKLNWKGESVTLRSDGTNILVVNRYSPESIIDAGAITISAVTTPPTKGTTTRDKFFYWKEGNKYKFRYEYCQDAGGANGSGVYLFPLTGGMVPSTTYHTTSGGTAASATHSDWAKACIGTGYLGIDSGTFGTGSVFLYSTTQFGFIYNSGFFSSGVAGLATAGLGFTMEGSYIVDDWEA